MVDVQFKRRVLAGRDTLYAAVKQHLQRTGSDVPMPTKVQIALIKWCCVKSAPWDAVVLIHGAHSREYDDIDPLIKTTFADATKDWWAHTGTRSGLAVT